MTEERKLLTVERLKELLDYDASTGVFTWKVNRRGHTKAAIRNNSGAGEEAWYARIRVSRRLLTIGRFSSPDDASAAYVAAKRRLHPGCTI